VASQPLPCARVSSRVPIDAGRLGHLLQARDVLATVIKNELFRAAFSDAPILAPDLQRGLCGALLLGAQRLV
jgi:hypothetical protein